MEEELKVSHHHMYYVTSSHVFVFCHIITQGEMEEELKVLIKDAEMDVKLVLQV